MTGSITYGYKLTQNKGKYFGHFVRMGVLKSCCDKRNKQNTTFVDEIREILEQSAMKDARLTQY